MKISYYELLGMIKEGNIPERIKVCLVGNKEVVYIAEFETEDILLCYMIENENEQDENYHYYLSECLIEYSMFDECIEIIEEEKEIEKIDNEHDYYCYTRYDSFKNDIDKVLYLIRGINATNDRITDTNLKLNELIDEVKKLKKE